MPAGRTRLCSTAWTRTTTDSSLATKSPTIAGRCSIAYGEPADRDHSGKLSREEFLAGLTSHRPERPADEKLPANFGGVPNAEAMEEIFRRLDRNQDGKVVGRRSARRTTRRVR